MFGIELLAKLLKVLKSGDTPAQIAWGFSLGMILGFTPFLSLHNLIIILIIIIFNVNISSAIFGYIVFGALAYLLDPVFHNLGFYLLVDSKSLTDFWTMLYNTPVISASGFNNTVVLGSLIISLLFFVPVFFLMKIFVIRYRADLEPKIQKLKIVQIIKGSKIYSFYEKVNNWRG